MADSCCESQIDVASLESVQRRVLTWVLVINVLTFLMMVGGSVLSGYAVALRGGSSRWAVVELALGALAVALAVQFFRRRT